MFLTKKNSNDIPFVTVADQDNYIVFSVSDDVVTGEIIVYAFESNVELRRFKEGTKYLLP